MMYRLIILTGPQSGQRITVQREPMVIGRDPDCAVCLKDDEVARKHAVLEHREEGLFVRDLGSMNRILVNKSEVREARLKHGDTIELGLTRLLVQALVQAEIVEELPSAPSNRLPVLGATAVAVVVLGIAGFWFWGWLKQARTAEFVPVAEEMTGTVESAVAETPPPEVAPTQAVTVAEEPVNEEIRRMRQDLAGLRESMAELATQKTAGAAGLSESEALRQKTLAMLDQARQRIAANNLTEADQILYSIMIVNPDFLPAYEERARLFEKRGLLKEAADQWTQIMKRGPETPMYSEAVAERLRLAQAMGQGIGQLRIASAEQRRLPESDDYDEMRMVDVALATGPTDRTLDAGAVRVDVVFFERDLSTGAVVPAPVNAPGEPLKPEGAWSGDEQKTVTATYVVPKGTRAQEAAAGKKKQFYGFMVRVFYHGELQDQTARPNTLLGGAASKPSSP